MYVWMVEFISTDGFQGTDGPFISAEYVTTSGGWTYSELNWSARTGIDGEDYYYAEEYDKEYKIYTGYHLYRVYVEGSE